MAPELATIASALVAKGKGILAADETPGTLSRRFSALSIDSTPTSRCGYREMLFAAEGLKDYVSGVILQDETIYQNASSGGSLVNVLSERGIVAGIKVDLGAQPLAGHPGETVTEGLDGLRGRLLAYRALGAQFAKWRAVIHIAEDLPSDACVVANAHALARYAALSQEVGLVPIVEPEVLMEGSHTLERCDQVTGRVLHAVFEELEVADVMLEAMLLKPNMVVAGKDCPQQPSVDDVASATMRRLKHDVPPAVPGIVFLSGGQSAQLATAHLNAINRLPGSKPWVLSFSYGRALQDPAMAAWHGDNGLIEDGRRALMHRARCNGAACWGAYSPDMERSFDPAPASPAAPTAH